MICLNRPYTSISHRIGSRRLVDLQRKWLPRNKCWCCYCNAHHIHTRHNIFKTNFQGGNGGSNILYDLLMIVSNRICSESQLYCSKFLLSLLGNRHQIWVALNLGAMENSATSIYISEWNCHNNGLTMYFTSLFSNGIIREKCRVHNNSIGPTQKANNNFIFLSGVYIYIP